MDRSLVDGILLVCATGTFNSVGGGNDLCGFVCWARNESSGLAVGCSLEVQKEVGTDTINPALIDLLSGGLVLEHDNSNVDGVGVELR